MPSAPTRDPVAPWRLEDEAARAELLEWFLEADLSSGPAIAHLEALTGRGSGLAWYEATPKKTQREIRQLLAAGREEEAAKVPRKFAIRTSHTSPVVRETAARLTRKWKDEGHAVILLPADFVMPGSELGAFTVKHPVARAAFVRYYAALQEHLLQIERGWADASAEPGYGPFTMAAELLRYFLKDVGQDVQRDRLNRAVLIGGRARPAYRSESLVGELALAMREKVLRSEIRPCVICGRGFEARRRSQRTCLRGACRSTLHRRWHKAREAVDECAAELSRLRKTHHRLAKRLQSASDTQERDRLRVELQAVAIRRREIRESARARKAESQISGV